MADLTERVIALEARVNLLEKLLDEARQDAKEGLIEIEAMKRSTHQVQYFNPVEGAGSEDEDLDEYREDPKAREYAKMLLQGSGPREMVEDEV